jgi:lipopolysaccharide transport protein LptA/LPS export ABC transporter protein LptC
LLAVLVIGGGGVAGLYYLGRSSRPITRPPEPQPSEVTGSELLRGEGFEHEVTREGKKIFVIRAERIASDEEDRFRLEGVELDFDRDNGEQYTIHSDWSTYDRKTESAILEGNVKLSGPNGLTLVTEGLELKKQGTLVTSSAPVSFGIADKYAGEASRITVNLRRNEFSLIGDVSIRGLAEGADQLTLQCQRLTFERDEHLVRVEGDVDIRSGAANWLTARRLSLLLADDEKSPRFLRARWGISGNMVQGSAADLPQKPGRLIGFAGMELSVRFNEKFGRPQRIELEGTSRRPARLQLDGGSGLSHLVRSRYLVGQMLDGSIRSIQLTDEVLLEERSNVDESEGPRRASGDTGMAQFGPNEGLTSFLLEGAVKLEQPTVRAFGDNLEVDLVGGETVITGTPVTLVSDRGQLEAPRIIHSKETGRIQALEGVRGVIKETHGPNLWGAGHGAATKQPVQVESDSAVWEDNQAQFTFLDGVKAWQGDSFLLADQMIAQTDSDQLSATGAVRTVWRPQSSPSQKIGEEAPSPVEVNADELFYSRSQRILTYTGNAKLRQERRTLTCDKMQIQTAEEDEKIQRLDCDGKARLEDPDSGNTVEGSVITYLPEDEIARVSGGPVVLRDQQGTKIEGRQLRYNLDSGTAELESRSDPTETADQAPADQANEL